MKSFAFVILIAAGCAEDHALDEHQGVCNDLDDTVCKADSRCQLAYVDSGFQPEPFPGGCKLLESGPSSTTACETLSFDACRARSDCSLLYWQDLGHDDRPVGKPYYKMCTVEPA